MGRPMEDKASAVYAAKTSPTKPSAPSVGQAPVKTAPQPRKGQSMRHAARIRHLLEGAKSDWQGLPANVVAQIGQQLPRDALQTARGVCREWKQVMGDAVDRLAPSRLLPPASSTPGPDGDGLLNFLRREATKHNGSDKHRAIINLMEDILCSPGLQRQAHAQITVRVQRWEMDFVRMALSFPLLTHLDLTGAVLVIAPGEGRSSSLRCDPSAAGFAHSHGTHSAPTCFGLSPLGLEEAVEPSAFPSRPSWASPLASAGVLGASGYPSRPVGASPLSRVGIAAELWGDQLAGPEASRVLQWLSLDERPASVLSASTQRLAALAAQNMMDGASGTSLNATFPPRRSPSNVVQALPRLQCLSLQFARMSDCSIPAIAAELGKPLWMPPLHIRFASAVEALDQVLGYGPGLLQDGDMMALAGLSSLVQLDLSDQADVTDVGFAALAALPQLQAVNLAATSAGDCALVVLSSCSSITSLNLARCRHISDVGFAALENLPNLLTLDATKCHSLSDDGVGHLAQGCSSLRTLTLSECVHITNQGMEELAVMKQLTRLDLSVCREVTDAGVMHLSRLTTLSSLDLTFIDKVTQVGVASLSRLKNLRDLGVACCSLQSIAQASLPSLIHLTSLDLKGLRGPITAADAAALTAMPRLESLILAFCEQVDDDTLVALSKAKSLKGLNLAFCKAVTDRGVGSLAAITALQSLNLQGCGRGLPHIGASLGKLTALHQLHSLNLSSTYLTHACMQALSRLTQLTELNLKYAKIVPPEPDLAVLSPLANLQNLNLGGCRVLHAPKFRVVRDCDMSALSGLSALRELNLSFCQNITDAGLAELRTLSNLKTLDVANCPMLSDGGLDDVITSLPRLSQMNCSRTWL
ncbi:hypothetical protein WJX84_004306 [Apatococcus fuscideae]|uniref:F-box/LRR-repeat protein 15-like leucin rich repeat domain-containing protein n=1 Tax=Apatococcus fuscideae TaxID=2026836 RepID=A0AAW1TD89_9CHLO